MRYLFYQGSVSEQGARNVQSLLTAAYQEGEQEVTLCLSSNGGDVNAGIGLFNFIGMLPITVNTHAAGMCGSITATIMLAGKKRTAAALSVFSIHAATYVEGPLIAQIAPNTELISQPFRDLLKWGDDEIAARFGPADFRFSPAQALNYGMIHEIGDLVLVPGEQLVNVAVP